MTNQAGRPGATPGAAGSAVDAPHAEDVTEDVTELAAEVRDLARERNAVILAHHYQRPEVQDVADYVGDSLGLARRAAASGAPVIVFCGVHFMAETAAILCPEATVILPDLEAGCSLAASVDGAAVRAWKAEHPDAVVVSYVNTSAEVKAESDYCCTSSNARAVIEAIPPDREILFLPDLFLGLWLERVTGRRLHLWPGECHVHAGIRPEDVDRVTRSEPDAALLVHPECGCTSQALAFANERTHVLSTQGMIEFARRTGARRLHVATEVGILYGLRRAAPGTEFVPIRDDAVCGYMKRITLPKVRDALRAGGPVVRVAPDVAARARRAIERMVAIGG
ncbi:MAG: quinolinate synthase [Chloroflexota bacterium]|nr:MAG: quinolinate synthase [Chloroflexota bacterium]